MILLCDSSFLFGWYDSADSWYSQARQLADTYNLLGARWVIPWPILYEVLNTRLARKREVWRGVIADWYRREHRGLLQRLDDLPYREDALLQAREPLRWGGRALSLVDHVLRAVILDPSVRVDYFVTMNPEDFIDVCSQRDVECLSPWSL